MGQKQVGQKMTKISFSRNDPIQQENWSGRKVKKIARGRRGGLKRMANNLCPNLFDPKLIQLSHILSFLSLFYMHQIPQQDITKYTSSYCINCNVETQWKVETYMRRKICKTDQMRVEWFGMNGLNVGVI